MKLVNLKLGEDLLMQIDNVASEFGFASRTEFMRNALRDKVEEYKLKQSILKLSKGKGIVKHRKTSEEEYEKAREAAFEKIAARFKFPRE